MTEAEQLVADLRAVRQGIGLSATWQIEAWKLTDGPERSRVAVRNALAVAMDPDEETFLKIVHKYPIAEVINLLDRAIAAAEAALNAGGTKG